MCSLSAPRRAAALVVFSSTVGCSSSPKELSPSAECAAITWYRDVDGDGFGDAEGPFAACEAPAGHVLDASDCDDQNPAVSPLVEETCNGVDDNCDGVVDEGIEGEGSTFWADTDGDGYGDPDVPITACTRPAGFVENALDCNDADPTISPEAEDAPRDGVDGDCDGVDATTLAQRAYVGDLTLRTSADLSDFCAEYDGVVGDLQLAGSELPASVALDCLLEVTGDVVLSSDATTAYSLPILWWVGGELRVAGNPNLTALEVPALRFVDGPLVWIDNDLFSAPVFAALEEVGALTRVDGGSFPVLTTIRGNLAMADGMVLNALRTVDGGVSIRDGSLVDLELARLETAGAIDLQSVQLRTLVLDALRASGPISLDLPNLDTELLFPALEVVDGDVSVWAGSADVDAPQLATVAGQVRMDHPGVERVDLRSLTTVVGPLLAGGDDLATLRLDALQEVSGAMELHCPGCDALNLEGLASVGEHLSLWMGMPLESLDLSSVSFIGGGFALTGAHRLRSLSMPSLVTLEGDAAVVELEFLESIDWSSLSSPGGEVQVLNLPALHTLDLSDLALAEISGHVIIGPNPNLETLSLGALGSEQGSLTLQGCPLVTGLDLAGLTSIGSLYLSGDLSALDLSDLQTSTGSITLAVDALGALELGALEVVGGDLLVSGDYLSVDLSALELVGGSFEMNARNASELRFPLLREVFSDLTLEINEATDVDLSALTSVGGSAVFLRALALAELSLPLLETVGTLTFSELSGVNNLSAPSLTTATGGFDLLSCDTVLDLDGFSALRSLGSSLTIAENALLEDVSGLSSLGAVGGNVRIEDNPSLPTSAATALVEDEIGESNIAGGVRIAGNGP